MKMPPLRPLLPAGNPDPANLSSQSSNGRRRPNARIACINCRKSKARCDGQSPCSACAKGPKDCVYPVRRLAMEQRNYSLQEEVIVLRELLQEMHSRSDTEAVEIFQRVRADGDFGRVLRLIQDGDLLIQPSMGNSIQAGSYENSNSILWRFSQREPSLYVWALAPQGLGFRVRSRYDGSAEALSGSNLHGIARDKQILQNCAPSLFKVPGVLGIFDTRIYGTPARTWTRVPCEDSRFADLLQLYFLIDHPFYEFVDRDLFLDDMVRKRTRFCSELLVNALLCYACHLSDQVECKSEPWHTRNIGSHFLQEARRLWQLEETNACLTTVQASAVLTVIMVCEGKDKVGSLFIQHGITMAKDLGFFNSSRAWETDQRSRKDRFKAEAIAAWSVFNYQALIAFHLRLPPFQTTHPPYPIPHSEEYESEVNEAHNPLEAYASEDALYFAAIRAKHCELCVHVNEIAGLIIPREGSPQDSPAEKWNEALGCYNNFTRWYHSIPSRLSVDANVCPQHMSFHSHCNMIIAVLGQFLINEASQKIMQSKVIKELRSDQHKCFSIMRKLVLQHTNLFSFKATSSVWFTFLGMVAANCLETIDTLPSRPMLQFCIKGIKEMTGITFIANSVIQSLCASAEKMKPGLSTELWEMLDSPYDRNQELRRIIDNTYSNFPSDYLEKSMSMANRSDMNLRSLAGMSLDKERLGLHLEEERNVQDTGDVSLLSSGDLTETS